MNQKFFSLSYDGITGAGILIILLKLGVYEKHRYRFFFTILCTGPYLSPIGLCRANRIFCAVFLAFPQESPVF
jgi:hypothetical protein